MSKKKPIDIGTGAWRSKLFNDFNRFRGGKIKPLKEIAEKHEISKTSVGNFIKEAIKLEIFEYCSLEGESMSKK